MNTNNNSTMTKYINEPNHLRLKPDEDKFYHASMLHHQEMMSKQPTFLKVGDGWERFKEGDLIDGGEVEIRCEHGCTDVCAAIAQEIDFTCLSTNATARLKHKEAGEESETLKTTNMTHEKVSTAIELITALLTGETLAKPSGKFPEEKLILWCERDEQGNPYFYQRGWGSAYGIAQDKVLEIIKNPSEWQIETLTETHINSKTINP